VHHHASMSALKNATDPLQSPQIRFPKMGLDPDPRPDDTGNSSGSLFNFRQSDLNRLTSLLKGPRQAGSLSDTNLSID